MFLKTGELKKIMKAGLKQGGLTVANANERYLVHSDCWGACVEHPYASNKFKAAIMELIGDLPEPGECYRYTIGADKGLKQESVYDYPDPYEKWKAAKDFAVITPMLMMAWPHEYMVVQRRSDKAFMAVRRAVSSAVISASELDPTAESMPGRACILGQALYFKNETTVYWVYTESLGTKVCEVLFPRLAGIDFFEDSWLEAERIWN